MKKDIKNTDDIKLLINSFYDSLAKASFVTGNYYAVDGGYLAV